MRPEPQRAELYGTGEGSNVFQRHVFARHVIFSVIVVLLYLLLNRPEVILLSQLGFSVWYPATGLILAVMAGISPWYFPLTVLAGALAGVAIYHQPLLSWSGLATPLLGSGSYAVAAYLLRGPLKIDLALRRRRDVLRYISVTLGAAVFATLDAFSLACKDHAKGAARESENRTDKNARGFGAYRTIHQHDFGALDYVWASTGTPATLLFGSCSDHLDRHASRGSASRKRSTVL